MTEEEEKIDPDELLKAIQLEESQKQLGKLKIFFGMSAGVGKTYSMLEAAQQRLKEGIDVVIGTINTHGRKETEKLLEGLPIIPEKWVAYKDTVFEELDLQEILQRKPQLVLIDELAHTNVPGSKHPKRWQDVIEILDAGIDVYTTLNVQHVESRKDIVEGITGIQIRETVPDLILERARMIELVDITPTDLLQRLKEGKVYLGDQSLIAAQNFFKEDYLTALREIALRFTAEKVDHDLHHMMTRGKGWKTRERLMVAISPSPYSQQLIRAARQLAFELDAPWVALYIDTGKQLSDEDQARLNKHLSLAQDLGAEVVTIPDLDIASAIQQVAKQKDITRIVIGRPARGWALSNLFQTSLIDRLEKENKHIDILILRQDKLTTLYQKILPSFSLSSLIPAYGTAVGVIAALTAVGYFLAPFIGYQAIGFLFLLGILGLSFFISQGPIFLAIILSALSWDFFFIPPTFNFGFYQPQDVALLIFYLFTAAWTGLLTTRIREQDQFLYVRETKIEHLYEIMREIANANNFQYLRINVSSRLNAIFHGEFDILTKNTEGQLVLDSSLPIFQQEKESSVAVWAFQNGKMAGWSTDTLPSAEALYIPIKFSKTPMGLLVYYPRNNRPLSLDEMNFIQNVTQQLGIYLERYLFEERLMRQDYTRQTEKLHGAIFHSLSRSFYAPLERVFETNRKLQNMQATPDMHLLFKEMENSAKTLEFIVNNVLAISELESGFVRFEKKKWNIKDLIDQCIQEVNPFANGHPIQIQLPPHPLFLSFDFHLMKWALNNLLLNAIEYSPISQPILVEVQTSEVDFKLSVIDRGPGIPAEVIPLIFEKFYRIPGSQSKGIGLGLSIVKSVADIHKGKIEVKNREEGGTNFSIILPL